MKRYIALSLICLVVLIAACGGGKNGSNRNGPTGKADPPFLGEVPKDAATEDGELGNYGGTLIMALPSNPKSFNPVITVETSSSWIINNVVYKALTDYDNEQQKDIPGLAKSWESSPDGLEWTLHLREGVRWSDGEPFTADDVLFTFQLTFDPNIAASARDLLVQTDGSLPVLEKTDDYTIKCHLKEPNALFIAALNNAFPVPKHKWEAAYKQGKFDQTMQLNADPKDIVGIGPYCISEYTPDQRVVLVRNPYYWKVDKQGQRLPYLDRIIFIIVPNFDTVALKFKNAETDIINDINPDAIDLLKRGEKDGDYTVFDLPGFNISYVIFNQDTGVNKRGKPYVDPIKLKWFRDPKFRQAVSYAIDREGMVKTVFLGHGAALAGFDPPANKFWFNPNGKKYPLDRSKAIELLKEIGISDRNGDGKLEDAEGNPIKFNLVTNSNRPYRVSMGALIKDDLAKIGIEVNFQAIEYNLMVDMFRTTRDFDAIIGSWQQGVPPDPIESKNVLLPGSNDYYAFPNQKTPSTEWEKKLASLVSQCSRTVDLEQRRKYYWEAMDIWSEYLPEIDLVVANYAVAGKNRVGNFKPSSLANYGYWNIEELFFKK